MLADLGPAKPLPPPPRPTRPPRSELALPTDRASDLDAEWFLDGPPLGATGIAPSADEIVAALAAIAPPPGPEASLDGVGDSEEFDPPPMIIGRAIAERLAPSQPPVRQPPNPWPGLLTGLALSLVAACGLFVVLIG